MQDRNGEPRGQFTDRTEMALRMGEFERPLALYRRADVLPLALALGGVWAGAAGVDLVAGLPWEGTLAVMSILAGYLPAVGVYAYFRRRKLRYRRELGLECGHCRAPLVSSIRWFGGRRRARLFATGRCPRCDAQLVEPTA